MSRTLPTTPDRPRPAHTDMARMARSELTPRPSRPSCRPSVAAPSRSLAVAVRPAAIDELRSAEVRQPCKHSGAPSARRLPRSRRCYLIDFLASDPACLTSFAATRAHCDRHGFRSVGGLRGAAHVGRFAGSAGLARRRSKVVPDPGGGIGCRASTSGSLPGHAWRGTQCTDADRLVDHLAWLRACGLTETGSPSRICIDTWGCAGLRTRARSGPCGG
jgi:hypothetical protein